MAPNLLSRLIIGESTNSTSVNPASMEGNAKADCRDNSVISVGSSCSASSMGSNSGENTLCLESKYLRKSLLCRYRDCIHFLMFPIPKRIGHISFKVTVSDGGYNLSLLNCDSLNLLQAKKLKIKSLRNIFSKQHASKHFEIHIAGAVETQLGDVVICKDAAIVNAKSFKAEYNKLVDGKGRICTRSHELSEAESYEICKMSKLDKSVILNGVREVHEWDGLHSITGFYGSQSCWPYEKNGNDHEFIHENLFNEVGRKLDFLGEKHADFRCITDSNSTLTHPDLGEIMKISKLKRKDEFHLQVAWPLSPLQALGLFVGSAESS